MDISRTTYKERNFTDYTKRTLPDHSVCSTKFSTFFISLIQNLIHFTCQKAFKKKNLVFKDFSQESKDFSRKNGIQGLFKDFA